MALGRRAWLFAGSNRGGQRVAFFNGLIVTAKLNDEWQLPHRYMTLKTMAVRTDEQQTALTHIAA